MGVSIRPCLGCLGFWSTILGTESGHSEDGQVHLDGERGGRSRELPVSLGSGPSKRNVSLMAAQLYRGGEV